MLKRRIDNVGRVCIPSQFINELRLFQNQQVEITVEYGEVCIKKFQRKDLETRQFVGIVRNLDSLHRISIPTEYIKLMGLEPGKEITLKIEKGAIKIN